MGNFIWWGAHHTRLSGGYFRITCLCLLMFVVLPIDSFSASDATATLEFYNGLGYDLYKEGKYKESIEMYEKALECEEQAGRARVYNNLGAAHYSLKQYSEAEDKYARALECDPDFTKAHVNLSAAHFRQGHYLRAVTILRKARKKDPKYVKARLDNDRTVQELRKETEKNPDDAFLTKLVALAETGTEESDSEAKEIDPQVNKILEHVNRQFEKLETYCSRVIRKTQTARGTVRQEWNIQLKLPEKIRLEWLGPEPMTFVCSGTEAWYHEPEENQVVHVSDMESGNMPDLDLGLNVLPQYIETHQFTLSPDSPDGQWFLIGTSDTDRVARIHLWLDSQSASLIKSQLFDRDGRMKVRTDYSDFKEFGDGIELPGRCEMISFSSEGKMQLEMNFLDLKVNEELGEEIFFFQVPEGAKVIEQ